MICEYPHLPALCRRHHVRRLAAFGSVLTAAFNDTSDIHLIVTFEPMPLEAYVDNYCDLKDALEALFDRPVDLLEAQAMRNPYLKAELDTTREVIFDTDLELMLQAATDPLYLADLQEVSDDFAFADADKL